MFVSVVIPTWNRAALLPGCIESLATQDYPDGRWEIVIVDDGSTDDTAGAVSKLQQRFAAAGMSLVYERRSHEGLNAARNAGIARARGNLVCFLDDDVRTPSTWLSELVAGVLAHPGAAAYGGPIALRVEGVIPRSCGREGLDETVQDWGPEPCEPATLFGSNLAVTRAAVTEFGGFNIDIECGGGDETEWLARARAGGGRIVYLPKPLVHHLRRPEDTRMRRLLFRRFSRGRAQVGFGIITDARFSVRAEVSQSIRSLVHSVRFRCALGLLPVATSLGRLVALLDPRGRRAGQGNRSQGG